MRNICLNFYEKQMAPTEPRRSMFNGLETGNSFGVNNDQLKIAMMLFILFSLRHKHINYFAGCNGFAAVLNIAGNGYYCTGS